MHNEITSSAIKGDKLSINYMLDCVGEGVGVRGDLFQVCDIPVVYGYFS